MTHDVLLAMASDTMLRDLKFCVKLVTHIEVMKLYGVLIWRMKSLVVHKLEKFEFEKIDTFLLREGIREKKNLHEHP